MAGLNLGAPQAVAAPSPAIAVLGCGYVGLSTAVCFAELGYKVTGIENDAAKLAGLQAGAPLFDELETTMLLQKHLQTGNLSFADRIADAAAAPAVVFLAVQTTDGDMTMLKSAAQEALDVMPAGGVLALRSTAAPGTGDALAPAAAKKGVSVVSNPEFLRQGYGVADFQGQKRVIVGADPQDAQAERLMRQLYGNLLQQGCEYCAVSRKEAELTKLMTNAYLANRVALVNTFADICRAADADADRVIRLLGGDSRIGAGYWNYGIGFGGSCLPKDTRLLAKFARQNGAEAQALDAALQSNDARAAAIAARIVAAQARHGGPIVIWGATFKPQSDDLRESQAAKIIDAVLAQTAAAAPQTLLWEPNCPAERLAARFPAAVISQDETLPQNATLAILMSHTQFSAPLAALSPATRALNFTR